MANLRVAGETARTKPVALGALLAGTIAAAMYWDTLLPGLDLGDTASFQTLVTLPILVPRHAYPLYFALGKLFVWLVAPTDPAYAMNVLSAAAGVGAVAAMAWLSSMLTGRAVVGFWAALLFAASYTFWSQALIAEVYTLEALFISVVFIAAIRWWRAATGGRLAVLYAIYALSFGNHLSMILLAPALVVLLWIGRNRATMHPFGARGLALATAIALAGALQYAWNFSGLWVLSAPRPPLGELMAAFWFDVTKSDWRASLVGTVPVSQWGNRLAMYWWDLQQQFGLTGIALAAVGVLAAIRVSIAIAFTLLFAYFVTFAFAFIYNVGDTHVFLLPSHQVVAIFAAFGASASLYATQKRRTIHWIAGAGLLAFAAWRVADTWPAVDRSADHRAVQYANASLAGIEPGTSVYVGDLNWQVQNAVGYEVIVHRPEMPRVFASQILWHLPEFVRRNRELGREIVLTKPAAEVIASAYDRWFAVRNDPRAVTRSFKGVAAVPRGTPYVLVVMTPLPEVVYDPAEVRETVRQLSGIVLPRSRYTVIAGVAGSTPVASRSGDRPFRTRTAIEDHEFDIRIESWLPADTMRRAGFGHVIVDRRHALTLERGANLGIFNVAGGLVGSANQGGSFAVQPRYVIPVLR